MGRLRRLQPIFAHLEQRLAYLALQRLNYMAKPLASDEQLVGAVLHVLALVHLPEKPELLYIHCPSPSHRQSLRHRGAPDKLGNGRDAVGGGGKGDGVGNGLLHGLAGHHGHQVGLGGHVS